MGAGLRRMLVNVRHLHLLVRRDRVVLHAGFAAPLDRLAFLEGVPLTRIASSMRCSLSPHAGRGEENTAAPCLFLHPLTHLWLSCRDRLSLELSLQQRPNNNTQGETYAKTHRRGCGRPRS